MPAIEKRCCVASSGKAGAGRSDQCGDVGLAVQEANSAVIRGSRQALFDCCHDGMTTSGRNKISEHYVPTPSVNPKHALHGNTTHAQDLANSVAKPYPLCDVHAYTRVKAYLFHKPQLSETWSPHENITCHSCQKPDHRTKTSHATAARNLTTASKHHTPHVELNAPTIQCTTAGTILPASP